jgi:uncharacterized membrane protein YeaQ/YmgE (transglycosylase-associated protein family)
VIINVIGWAVVGLIAGLLAGKTVNKRGEGTGMDVVLGIVAAVAGGWLFRAFGWAGDAGLSIGSVLVAFIGALVLLMVWHGIRGALART